MGRVFRNQQEIPIPDFAYVNASDGRVFTIHRDERNKRQHITIGWATSKVTMHPNENFKFLYPKPEFGSLKAEKMAPIPAAVGGRHFLFFYAIGLLFGPATE